MPAAARRLRIITKAIEPAASKAIAIRIGTSGEELPLSEPGCAPVSSVCERRGGAAPPLPELPWPAWVAEPPPFEDDFAADPPFLALPAALVSLSPPPTPLVDEEPPDRFDSLGGLPVAEGGALEYSNPAEEA